MAVNLSIPTLGDKFQDYRKDIPGDSYGWGPVINATKIDAFTFHHSVTKPQGSWKDQANQIAQLHLNRGWGGIGYRFVIASDGTVAYVGDLGRGGSAVANHNDHMFSAVFVGDFTKHLPTASQVHSAHLLAKHFLTQMPQYPNLARWDQIKGHQDFNPTACPGSNWRTGGDTLYNRIVNDRFQGYPDPQPEGASQPEPTPQPPADDYEELREALEEALRKAEEYKTERNQRWEEFKKAKEEISHLKEVIRISRETLNKVKINA